MTVNSTNARKIVRQLKQRGFDESYSVRGRARVMCSQCEALAINGIGCHEQGCPNQAETKRDQSND